jgi:hypothetical protein
VVEDEERAAEATPKPTKASEFDIDEADSKKRFLVARTFSPKRA